MEVTRDKLNKLSHELSVLSLLSDKAPSIEAMQSTAPFACDVMPFEHWLQFIFLPKMHYLLDNNIALPTAISIAPMAEHVWSDKAEFTLIKIILTELDELLSGQK